MPFRNGRGPAKRPGMGAVTVYLELTLKLHGPVQNRHIHGRDARRSEREVPVHSNAPRRRDDRRPGLGRKRHSAPCAFCSAGAFGFARRHDRFARNGFPLLEPIEIARHIGVEDVRGIDLARVEVEREHAVGEFAVRPGRAVAGERAADEFAEQREARAFVLAEGADGAGAAAVVARTARG